MPDWVEVRKLVEERLGGREREAQTTARNVKFKPSSNFEPPPFSPSLFPARPPRREAMTKACGDTQALIAYCPTSPPRGDGIPLHTLSDLRAAAGGEGVLLWLAGYLAPHACVE